MSSPLEGNRGRGHTGQECSRPRFFSAQNQCGWTTVSTASRNATTASGPLSCRSALCGELGKARLVWHPTEHRERREPLRPQIVERIERGSVTEVVADVTHRPRTERMHQRDELLSPCRCRRAATRAPAGRVRGAAPTSLPAPRSGSRSNVSARVRIRGLPARAPRPTRPCPRSGCPAARRPRAATPATPLAHASTRPESATVNARGRDDPSSRRPGLESVVADDPQIRAAPAR